MRLSVRHLKDLHLPDKAIDVIDEAGAAQKLRPAEQRVNVIGVAEIEHIVARMARVPVQAVSNDDKLALQNLETELKAVIFGQDRRDRGGRVGDQALAFGFARRPTSRSATSCSPARPASARPSWRVSSRA